MSTKFGIRALMLTLVLIGFSLAESAEIKKVRIAFTSYTIEQLPYQLAEKKGYFTEEGLSPEFIYMRSTTITMALASQNLLYSSGASSGIQGAVTGRIDAKVLWVASSKTLMFLMAKPEINASFRPKRQAHWRFGNWWSLGCWNTCDASGKWSQPSRGDHDCHRSYRSSTTALQAGVIDATPLISPRNFQAETLGFRNLGFMGDFMPNAFGGFSIHSIAFSQEPQNRGIPGPYRTQRVKGHENDRGFTLDMLQKFTKMEDKELAQRTYDANIAYFTSDGIISEAEQRDILEESKKQLKVDQAVSLSVFDFSLAQKMKKELQNWRP